MMHRLKFLQNEVFKDMKLCKDHGLYLGILTFIDTIILRGSNTSSGKKLNKYLYNSIQKKLSFKYQDFINNYHLNNRINCIDLKKLPIWLFWWQGIENAPDVVKVCINSIRISTNREIIIIDQNNYFNYINIPSFILEKVNRGEISLNHFSDILRLCLLYEHGGTWMDATLFTTSGFDSDMEGFSLYSIKHGQFADYHVCRGYWSGFFLHSQPKNGMIEFVKDFLFEYWKTEKSLICYLLIDVGFCIAYDNFSWAKEMIDNIPTNNTDVFKFQENMNMEYNELIFENWCKGTHFHKVSYKRPFKKGKNGLITYWDYILSQPR